MPFGWPRFTCAYAALILVSLLSFSMASVTNTTTGDYAAALARHLSSSPPPNAVLFTASWCGDSRRVHGGVLGACAARKVSLFVVDVGHRNAWKGTEHPLRTSLQLVCVPSVLMYRNGVPTRRLDKQLEAAPSEEAARLLVDAFLQGET